MSSAVQRERGSGAHCWQSDGADNASSVCVWCWWGPCVTLTGGRCEGLMDSTYSLVYTGCISLQGEV